MTVKTRGRALVYQNGGMVFSRSGPFPCSGDTRAAACANPAMVPAGRTLCVEPGLYPPCVKLLA
ncbi:hypothetical protein A6M21_14510 [Desulfotomaculum copahuensis]|uniref:Uncharacterized protein n=1 Tax=Desulfotomaculum copahuensis TaxID=1838280 RepID=A0A1B7LBS9_9FIRM|nr:hypothetical protein A6M21_14510 [Desulfotomaculum copahuensis]